MRKLEMFETEDGKLFHKESEGLLHESYIKRIDAIVKLLGGTNSDIDPKSSDFANGNGYYSINPVLQLQANEAMKILVCDFNMPDVGFSSRRLYEHEYLGKLAGIYACIKSGKRYGQSYYANNGPKINKEWNLNFKGH